MDGLKPIGLKKGEEGFATPSSSFSPMGTNFGSTPNTYTQVAKMFSKRRVDAFATGHAVRYSGTDVGTPNAVTFTSNPAGKEIERGMIGAGEFVVDPMQNLQADIAIEHFSARGSSMSDPGKESTASIRSRGISAYKKMTKEQG